jgi:hypothetical protein
LLLIGGEKMESVVDPRAAIPVLFDISSTSRAAFRSHIQFCADRGVPHCSVVSRITFDAGKDLPAPLWKAICAVPAGFKPRVRDLVRSAPRIVTTSPWPLTPGVEDDRDEPAPAVKATGAKSEPEDPDLPF